MAEREIWSFHPAVPCHHERMAAPVPSTTPADVLRRIRDLAAAGPAAGHITDQHVISKVILKRFAAPGGPDQGLICPFRLRYPQARHRPLGPDGCGKVPNFVSYASASMERLWKETEDKLPDALLALDAGVLFHDESHVATIKDSIALHFARSKATRVVHYRVWEDAVAAGRRRWMTEWRPRLEYEFYKKKGFYAAGEQALTIFLDELMELSMSLADSGALFRERLEDLYQQARNRAGNAALEIFTAGGAEFLIGDVPALTVRRDRYEVGVLGGISMDDAQSVFFPLGPRHVASLGKVNVAAEMTTEQVRETNTRQLLGAIEYVYLRPGSGLEEYVHDFAERKQAAKARRITTGQPSGQPA
jgi:Protein of unknown function (DUF4238)